jgi:hypothetical protein
MRNPTNGLPTFCQIMPEGITRKRRYHISLILSRVCGDYYKTGIGLTTGFIGSHTVTHNYSVYTLPLTIAAATLLCRLLLGPNTHS